jgi:hypothetical protein
MQEMTSASVDPAPAAMTVTEPPHTSSPINSEIPAKIGGQQVVRRKDFGFLPIPKNRRYDPSASPGNLSVFTWKINIVFAVAAVSGL